MLEKITEAEINERSMARVSTTPGRRTGFGENNLNPEALKLRFDRLGRFLAGKINEILGSIEDGSIAEYIYVDHNGNKISVEQFITNLLNGDVDNIQIKTAYGIVYLTEIAMKTEEMYNGQFTGDGAKNLVVVPGVTLKGFYEEFKAFEGETAPVQSVNGKKGDVELNAEDVGARPDTWMPTAEDVNAEPVGAAASAVEAHNNDGESHQDIRGKLRDLTDQMANAGAVKSVNGKTGDVELNAEDVGARPNTWIPGYSEVGADKAGTADSKVSAHNVSDASHNDIRLLIQGLGERLNAIANSTDIDLDDFKEVVAYIKANRGLIDAITTNKINYTDIINDLVTNSANRPLSAAQGVVLNGLIQNLTNNKLDSSALTSAINTALAQAKASGEFKGADGKTPYIENDYWYINGTSTGVKAQGNDGKGISSVAKTSTSGLVDTYTITFTDGTKTTYTVTNGKDGKDSASVPTYVLTEAEATAKKVLNHQSADSFTLAWLSDMHVGHVYQALGWKPDETSVIEAGQGLYELNKECPLDVITFGGDLAAGVHNTTREDGLEQIDKCERYMRPSSFFIPTLRLRGNHDDAPYQATEGRLTPTDLYQRFGRKNIASGANIVKGKNYGYRDFETQKMRVIYLDTHDKEGWVSTKFVLNEDDSCPYLNACNVSAEQLDWLANTALNFSDKEAPSEWGIVICSHTQLNIHATPWTYTDETTGTSYEANTTNVITILTAYLSKGSGSITLNGKTMNYDFSTLTDKAYLYCCINGHNHCEKTYTYGSKKILGIACPAVRDGAERVSADGNTYTKTAGTGDSTSFTVITIDRVNNKIYADIHGAGTDREFDVVVYSDYTNVLKTAYTPPTANNITPIDTSVFDGVGYRNGVRLSGWSLSSNADYVATGVIRWRESPGKFTELKPIYIKGATLDLSKSYVRCNIISLSNGGLYLAQASVSGDSWKTYFTIETLGENYYKLSPIEANYTWTNIICLQFSLLGKGENLIITLGEPIE